MEIRGLWKATFQTPLGIGYGVVVLGDGKCSTRAHTRSRAMMSRHRSFQIVTRLEVPQSSGHHASKSTREASSAPNQSNYGGIRLKLRI